MTIGIMQPYIFPYIGYFQLIDAVDVFVFYDDVNFIKQGWINRNRILLNGRDFMFTIPLKKVSSFSKINELSVDHRSYHTWTSKFFRTLHQSYRNAPYYNIVSELVHTCLEVENESISELTKKSVQTVCDYLGIKTKIINSSAIFQNTQLSGPERVIDICKQLGGQVYVNPIGGQSLYSNKQFMENALRLNFLQTNEICYQQTGSEFVPWLSILDVMMFNSISEINTLIGKYKLI